MRRTLSFLLSAAVLLGACSRALDPAEDIAREPAVREAGASALVPGSVILQLDEDQAELFAAGIPATKSGALCAALDGMGVVSVERLYPDAGEWEPRHREAGLHRWFRVTYDPAASPVTKAADDFGALPGVMYAEPERRIRSTSVFNDPRFSEQWSFFNDGSRGYNYSAGCDINVVPVWENYTAGSPDVIVAVLDGGVQLDHPDLAAVTIPAGANGSRSFIQGYGGYNIPADNHGTHVAGVIAAVNDNETGVCGIAGGRDGQGGVHILSCPFMMEDPSDPDKTIGGDSYQAMVWAADHGAVISQNSWGYVFDSESEAAAGDVGGMGPAIDYFIKYAGCDKDGNQRADSPMKGGVVIFSAGNETWAHAWPAAYEPVIAVGATSAKFSRAYYSNYGDWVDICAPGGDANLGTLILSTIAGSSYGTMQGTSMACPHVSGVAALIVSYFGGPGFTNEMLKERLLEGANRTKVAKNLLIGPMVDALGSFTLKGTEPPLPAADITASASSNDITLSWKVTADPDDVKAYGYLALASTDAAALKDLNPRNIPSSVKSVQVEVGSAEIGETISATLSGLSFETSYYVAVIAYDYSGNYSALSPVKSVRTGKNNAPVIRTDYTGSFQVKPFASLSVTYSVSDPDGHAFTVEVDPGSDALTPVVTADAVTCRIAGNGAPHGKYTAHIVATDAYGASTDYAIPYEILENHAPAVVSAAENMQFGSVGESLTLDMDKYIRDEDGEQLSYNISMTEQNVAHLNPNGNALVLTTLGYGLTTVTVTATDACKASCSMTFMILVRDASRPVDLYPNPVVSTLNIRPGTEGQLEIAISNRAGATVWSGTSAASPFAPVSVDMSGMAGGTYYVRVQGAGIDDVYPIAKR